MTDIHRRVINFLSRGGELEKERKKKRRIWSCQQNMCLTRVQGFILRSDRVSSIRDKFWPRAEPEGNPATL